MTNFAVAATSDTVPQATTNTSRFRTIAGIRLERNAVLLGAILVAIVFAAMIGALSLGDYPMTTWETIANLFGFSDDYLGQFFVQSQRLPRVMATIAVGAALGVSGCIFQQLSGNTLGSPDIIGFTTGSATGAVVTIIVLDGSPIATAVGALLGGAGAALAVYALTLSNGKLSAARLVLVGIGMASILSAVNALLMVKASINAAQTAAQWLAGSFNATTWGEVGFALSAILVLVLAALLLARPLSVMITGDDLAIGLGVDVERRRRELMIVGVALTAISVAVAGPIAFVALAAPQLARRISRASGIGMGNAALMGAALVAVSDIIAQRIFAPTQLPVGVVTGLLGGVYLVWLLGRQWRK
ncbi:iron chelate uptake ABC transporter family permease subunit [Corynebacterium matruchotii]|uniref:FecCD family ABC transporter permease n=1 Tax=Corynebacterium matruchotii TaxID=43768 RepID=UPI0028E84F19|nr:iron chelate uptake ABC transporter family permease subunit [Corynebacterium matruchotii]